MNEMRELMRRALDAARNQSPAFVGKPTFYFNESWIRWIRDNDPDLLLEADVYQLDVINGPARKVDAQQKTGSPDVQG